MAITLAGCTTASADAALGSGLPPAVATAPVAAVSDDGPTFRTLDGLEAAVTETLDAVAAAFLAGDPGALRPWLTDPDGDFGRRWLARAADIADVPLSAYTLRLDDTLPDLTTPDVPGRDGLLVNVLEDHQLVGFEALGPLREHLYLTLREVDGRWTVAGDTAGEALGLVSADHLWDHGPVVATRRGSILALHHPGQASVGTVLDEAEQALATTDARWPLDWPSAVPLLVPADQAELAELLHVTFDLSNFIAFATTTPVGELGDVELAGSRVMLNTGRFLERSSATRERILVHEFVHAASRPSSSGALPSWLEEGVAQALGEQQSTTGTRLLDALADGGWDGTLPLDAEFTIGSRDDTFLSYQRAWSFVDWLADEFGADAVGRFYAAAGAGQIGRPGTVAAQVDAAAAEVFGAGVDELRRRWRAAL